VKRLITKSKDPYIALLKYLNTKIDGVDISSAQLFLRRRLKSLVPIAFPLLESTIKDNAVTKLKQRQQKQQENFNRHALKKNH
jgi:ABC-type multidrug transport system fused ATPase/permease subunit